jgi:hypothetical protein
MPTVRILSCVPQQLNDTQAKLDWIKKQLKTHEPDILVTPQEFFGGAFIMPHKKEFTRDELLPPLKKIIKTYKCALVIGLVENIKGRNKEVIWFLNEDGELVGSLHKFALPKYDHIATKGYGDIEPETDFEKRFQTFELKGIRTSAIFCWEAYSDLLWTGLGLCQPHVVFSMIKFGVNSWPVVRKKEGLAVIEDFGYGSWKEEGRWIDRLHIANVWQVKCPIICSTNSWNLKPRSMPLAGMISGIDGQGTQSFWTTSKDMKVIPEKVIVDELNSDAVSSCLLNKFVYKDRVGEFPPYSLAKYTMMLKIKRIEDRVRSGREAETVKDARSKSGKGKGFGF